MNKKLLLACVMATAATQAAYGMENSEETETNNVEFAVVTHLEYVLNNTQLGMSLYAKFMADKEITEKEADKLITTVKSSQFTKEKIEERDRS